MVTAPPFPVAQTLMLVGKVGVPVSSPKPDCHRLTCCYCCYLLSMTEAAPVSSPKPDCHRLTCSYCWDLLPMTEAATVSSSRPGCHFLAYWWRGDLLLTTEGGPMGSLTATPLHRDAMREPLPCLRTLLARASGG